MNPSGAAMVVNEANAAPGPLAESIFNRLLGRIYSGDLAAGAVLNESTLADEYGVSRGPVREAIRRLQGFQLVTREPYQRARVVQMTPSFVRQLFEVRMALEGMACNLAAQRMSSDELERIGDELESSRACTVATAMPFEPGESKPFDFHESIVRGCGNDRITEMLCGDLYHLLRVYRKRSGDMPERRGYAFEEHWQILRALKARDGHLADSLMRAHIGRANELLLGVQGRTGAAVTANS